MISMPPPNFALLTPEQTKVITALLSHFEHAQFEPAILHTSLEIQNAVNSLASVCKENGNLSRLIAFTEQMVRWYPLPGLWLAFYLQSLTKLTADIVNHISASLSLSDAQINFNDDLALHSTEVAYDAFLAVKNELCKQQLPDAQRASLATVEKDFVARLRFFYLFYSYWSKPIDPGKFNPLTDNLYYFRTHRTLSSEFPNLDFKDNDKAEGAYLTVINQCVEEDFYYYRIIARRHLADWYLRNKKADLAIDQLKLGLEEAVNIDLKAEVGHFFRLLGYINAEKLNWQEAADCLYAACKFDSTSLASYWGSLSARELAHALRIGASFGVKMPQLPPDSHLDYLFNSFVTNFKSRFFA